MSAFRDVDWRADVAMASTRARLTVSYALVLLGTMVAFGAAVWAERRSSVETELGREALRVADNVFFTIQSSPTRFIFGDSSASSGAIFKSTKDLADALDPVRAISWCSTSRASSCIPSALMRLLSAMTNRVASVRLAVG
jgi:hypothetical protein